MAKANHSRIVVSLIRRLKVPRPMAFSTAEAYGLSLDRENAMQKPPKKKEKCANCEGKGLIKLGDKKVKCQRCGGSGFKASAPAH
jgi:hypothetical protein